MDEEQFFAVCWEEGDENRMDIERLGHLPFDLASWANFLAFQMGRASHAAMTLHKTDGKTLRAKIIPWDRYRHGIHYGAIT